MLTSNLELLLSSVRDCNFSLEEKPVTSEALGPSLPLNLTLYFTSPPIFELSMLSYVNLQSLLVTPSGKIDVTCFGAKQKTPLCRT